MLKDTLIFYDRMEVDKNLIEKVLNFNYYHIETLTDLELSKYSIILAQYLIYFKWQLNKTKVDHLKAKNRLETTLFHLMSSEVVKQYKTKTDARSFLINSTSDLISMNENIDLLEYELLLADGLDKPIQEMINVFKREQGRRENELNSARFERR